MYKFGFITGLIIGLVASVVSVVSWVGGISIVVESIFWTNVIKIALGLMFLPGVLSAGFCAAMLDNSDPWSDFGTN